MTRLERKAALSSDGRIAARATVMAERALKMRPKSHAKKRAMEAMIYNVIAPMLMRHNDRATPPKMKTVRRYARLGKIEGVDIRPMIGEALKVSGLLTP